MQLKYKLDYLDKIIAENGSEDKNAFAWRPEYDPLTNQAGRDKDSIDFVKEKVDSEVQRLSQEVKDKEVEYTALSDEIDTTAEAIVSVIKQITSQ